MHLTSCETLVILITSIGELLLYYCRFFLFISFHCKKKKKKIPARLFLVLSCVALFIVAGIHFPVDLNCDQMEKGEQYSEHSVERNLRAYMSRRDYRNKWMSSPYGSTYSHSWGNHTNSSWEPRPPYYASTPQSPQPPQLIPPFE